MVPSPRASGGEYRITSIFGLSYAIGGCGVPQTVVAVVILTREPHFVGCSILDNMGSCDFFLVPVASNPNIQNRITRMFGPDFPIS